MAFAQDVKSLTGPTEEMGNPSRENSSDLLMLDSRNFAKLAVGEMMSQIEKLGLDQYEMYVNERPVNQTIPITDPIKRNNLHLFVSLCSERSQASKNSWYP